MKSILTSVQPVIQNSRSVKINLDAIKEFSRNVKASDLEGSEFAKDDFVQRLSEEQNIAFTFLYNAVNFSYWGSPKWAITIEAKEYDGSDGMVRALRQAIGKGTPLLDATYLATLPERDFAQILRGNVEIPLFAQRLNMVHQLGDVISKSYRGSFTAFIDASHWDTAQVVLNLAQEMPEVFNDVVDYHGNKVEFYKRAQLIPAHIYDLHRFKVVSREISGFSELTAFADYKVPQLLRRFGILEYSKELADKIDNLIEIPEGSDEEVEIRAATIWAVELATKEVKKSVPAATAAQVDGIFWFTGQNKSADDKPYHRTRTAWY